MYSTELLSRNPFVNNPDEIPGDPPPEHVRKLIQKFGDEYDRMSNKRLKWAHKYQKLIEKDWVDDWKAYWAAFEKWEAEMKKEAAKLPKAQGEWFRKAIELDYVKEYAITDIEITVGDGKEWLRLRPHHSHFSERRGPEFDSRPGQDADHEIIRPYDGRNASTQTQSEELEVAILADKDVAGPKAAEAVPSTNSIAPENNALLCDSDGDSMMIDADQSRKRRREAISDSTPNINAVNPPVTIEDSENDDELSDTNRPKKRPRLVLDEGDSGHAKQDELWGGAPLHALLTSVCPVIKHRFDISKMKREPLPLSDAIREKRWISAGPDAAFVLECPCIDTSTISAVRTGPWARHQTHELIPRCFHSDPFQKNRAAFHFRVVHGITFKSPTEMIEQYGRPVHDGTETTQPDGHTIAVNNLALQDWHARSVDEWHELYRTYSNDSLKEQPERTVSYEDVINSYLATFKWPGSVFDEQGVIICSYPDCSSVLPADSLDNDVAVKHFMQHGLCLEESDDVLRLFGFKVVEGSRLGDGAPSSSRASRAQELRRGAAATDLCGQSKGVMEEANLEANEHIKSAATDELPSKAGPSSRSLARDVDNFAELEVGELRDMCEEAGLGRSKFGTKGALVYKLVGLKGIKPPGKTKMQLAARQVKRMSALLKKRVVNGKLEYWVEWDDKSPSEWIGVTALLQHGENFAAISKAVETLMGRGGQGNDHADEVDELHEL